MRLADRTRLGGRRGLLAILLALALAVVTAIVVAIVIWLVDTKRQEGESQYDAVYVVSVDGSGLRRLTHDRREHELSWSPDGTQIAAQSEGIGAHNALPGPIELMRPGGGAVRQIHVPGFAGDPVWRSGDTLELLETTSVSSMTPTRIFDLSLPAAVLPGRSIGPIGAAAWSPDGDRLAVVPCRGGRIAGYLEVLSAAGRAEHRLGALRGGLGEAVCQDPESTADEALAWAPDARSLYVLTSAGLWRYPVSGARPSPVGCSSQAESAPALSPDGRWLITELQPAGPGETHLYLCSAYGGHSRLLTEQPGDEPVWSPNGEAIAFASGSAIYTVPLTGGRARRVVELSGESVYDVRWSPDGRRLGFVARVNAPET